MEGRADEILLLERDMVAMGMVSSPPHVEETPCRGKIQSLGYMPAEGVMRFIVHPWRVTGLFIRVS